VKSLLPLFLIVGLVPTWTLRGDEKEEKKEETPPPAPAPADPKLLQGIMRDLLQRNMNRPRPGRPFIPGQAADSDGTNKDGDPVDSRAPRDAKVEQLLQAADLATKQKNWKSAVDLFQRLLDQPEDTLHRTSNGQWQSVRRTANQMLGQLPEATLGEYRSQYGGLAQQKLNEAKRSGQTADFVNIATRFFHTPAGYEAAHFLAAQHFDRSEFGLAARWFEELVSSPAPIARNDAWLLQAALAFARSGDSNRANQMLERLTRGPETLVPLATGSFKAQDWLTHIQTEAVAPSLALTDWTQLYGTAARTGTAVGGDALLSPNWSLPLTSSHNVRNSLKWLVHDLQDQQRAMILAAVPLVIDGKVIYRDLRGMRCVDIERGTTIWESIEGVSAEQILGGLPSQQIDPKDAWRQQVNPFQNMGEFQGLSAEYSPLTSLLFRDGTYGLISSDGHQLFVIEDHGILSRNQPGQHWGWDGNAEPQDPYGLPWKTNRLVSYDLQTGRTLWSLGGNESRESFELPLAGSYFYGTPAVDGDDLFLVAGKGDDVRMWCVNRRTGVPQWSQLIAYSDTKIDLDIARRWVTSQVAVGDGVVICPTTVGWLVAIDRMRQSVLWAHRYTARSANSSEREPGAQFLPQRELNAQWSPSAPVIAGRYVVFTPQDEPILFCLNAVDGQKVWEKPKERGLYLAGVFDQIVLIVGETGATGIQLADGKPAWTTTFDETVRPSGRGVAVDDHFYLPLSSGELQTIEITTGQVLQKTYVGSRQPALGNLAMHHGSLVSLSPSGLTGFGQRDAILAEIKRRLTADPDDAWALLRSSEIQLLNRQYADAIPLLRKIDLDRLTVDQRNRQHVALVESLSTLIHNDILNHSGELNELKQLVSTPAEQLQYHELTAEKLLAEKQSFAAFEVFTRLADQSGDITVVRTDDRHVTAHRMTWLCGRMLEIWSTATEVERRKIDQLVASKATDAAGRGAEACQRIAQLFAFHPAAIDASHRFVEALIEGNDFSGARLILQGFADRSEKPVAARAIERLARLMVQQHLPDDAVYYYRLLESDYGDTVVRDGKTGVTIANEARTSNQLEFEPHQRGVSWKETPLRVEQSVVNYTQPSQDVVHETSLPFFDRLNLEAHQNEQRLSLESAATGEVEWMMSLRSAVRGADEGYLTTSHIGHQLFFVNRGVLHAVSPIEKQVLWTKSLDDFMEGDSQARHSVRPTITAMMAPIQDESQSLLLQRAYTLGHLAVVQANYLCVYGRRSLTVLDPRTGNELWKLDGLPTNAQVVGTRDALFAVVQGKNEASAYRALDGKPIEIPGVAKLLNHALMTHGSSLLLLEQNSAGALEALGIKRTKTQKTILRLYDPVARTNQWQLEFQGRAVVSPLGENEVVVVLSDGQVQRIDVASGAVADLDSILFKKNALPVERYLLADDDQIYLITNTMDNGSHTFGESLNSIRVNGTIQAWNRADNKLCWPNPVKVSHQNLIVDRFQNMPVMLFISRTWRRRGRANMGSLNVIAIQKQSGKSLLDSKVPSVYSGFHAINIHPDEPSIELRSYNVRMRLIPTEEAPPADATQPVGSG